LQYNWGFSGIVSLFLGVLYYPLFVKLRELGFRPYSLFIFIICLTFNIILVSLRFINFLIIGSLLLLIFSLLYALKQRIKIDSNWSLFNLSNFVEFFSIILFIIGIFVLFPKPTLGSDGTITNILGHYIGFLIGLTFPQIFSVISPQNKTL